MEVFVRVAECGSFSRAAESLDLANATVTTQVRELERHLGVTLINRDTRRLRLTEEGREYLARARALLQSLVQAEDDLRERVGQLRGRLHVEAPISVGHALLCPALPLFSRRHPQISVSVTLTNQPHHVIERAIDVAIRMDKVEDAELVARPIHESRHVICCAPALADALPPHPRDLDAGACLGVLPGERAHPVAWSMQRGDERVELLPAGPLHLNSSAALLAAAAAGAGLVCVLDIFAAPYIADGRLVRVYPEWELPVKTFYLVTPKARAGSAKVRAFTDFLFEVLDNLGSQRARRAVAVRSTRRRS